MRQVRLSLVVFTCILSLAVVSAALAAEVTLEDLLLQQVDLQRLAQQPEPGVTCKQFSSYDRHSVAPDQPNWFANGDAGQFLYVEDQSNRVEYVMADMEGPGAIVRLWSANPEGGGTLRIYLDDMAKPALEVSFHDLTTGKLPQFPAPFSHRLAKGANLYFPFTYQRHCKVTVSKPGLYYHVDYKTFPPGTKVEKFSLAKVDALRPVLMSVARKQADPMGNWLLHKAVRRAVQLKLAPHQRVVLGDYPGPAAIGRLKLQVDPKTPHLATLLRGTLFTIQFDDQAEPAVCAPLGDFFGSAPGLNPFQSLPNGMMANGACYSNWYMPFGKHAVLSLQNTTDWPLELKWASYLEPLTRPMDRLLYFHAKWHKQWFEAEPRFIDWPILKATGRGRFVGDMLAVMNTTPTWWGEGDEKIWVDDDTFPSFFGTGSEDYFGYAWCNTALFSSPFHNQSICTGPGNFGYTAVARYHIVDDLPFQRKFEFTLEKWDASPREYAACAYWYADGEATDFFKTPTAKDLVVRPLPQAGKIKGAIEGETLKVLRCTKGSTRVQTLNPNFSNWRHLWWTGGGPEAELELAVPVKRAGRYKVLVGVCTAPDYGIFQFYVNGKPAGKPRDLYAPSITAKKLDLGVHELAKGTMRLGLKCLGINPKATARNYMAGIDYVLLQEVK